MISLEVFASFIISSYAKGYPASFLLDGTPVTLSFRGEESPIIMVPKDAELPNHLEELVGSELKKGEAWIGRRDDNSSHITVNAIAEIELGDKVVCTDAMELMINPSAVSLLGFGPFKG